MKNKYWRIAIIGGVVACTLFAIHISFLYRSLETAFLEEDEFVPTRIYSDVTKIEPDQSRQYITNRLKGLGYQFQADGFSLFFTLNPVRYPLHLIPNDHPTIQYGGKKIELAFEDNEANSVLQSIYIGETHVPELYLEPELITSLTRPSDEKIRNIVQFSEMPSLVWKSIIAIEDQHFLDHRGFDPRGFARAVIVNLKTLSLKQGGSTITQQLVKNLMARRGKNVFRKFSEIFLALLLELRFDKETILERYLNEVYLGQIGSLEVHGVAEGARYFFGKKITELHLGEVALLAGLIRGPGYYSPYRHWERAVARQRLILNKMVETGQIAPEQAAEAAQKKIRLSPPPSSKNRAPYFTDFVKAQLVEKLKDKLTEAQIINAGFRVYTTLHPYWNELAQKTVKEGVDRLKIRFFKNLPQDQMPRLEGALASVDHRTGFIRALIGGVDYAQSNFNRILNMKRQVGSTFKPLVYLTALMEKNDPFGGTYGPAYPIEDAPFTLSYEKGRKTWSPRNYEQEYRGWISLREALAHSINIAAAKVGNDVGLKKIIETARSLGVESPISEVPSLTLGAQELSPVELLRVYATLANHGTLDELTVIRAITEDDGQSYARFIYHPKEVLNPGFAHLMTDLLQDVFAFGTARSAKVIGFERPAAGKTGTTNDFRDAWFAGYTPQLTTVVWVGLARGSNLNEKGKPIVRLTGAGAALPIWATFMKKALENTPPLPFELSDHLVGIPIDRYTGNRALSECGDHQVLIEKFVIGNEPDRESCAFSWLEKNRMQADL